MCAYVFEILLSLFLVLPPLFFVGHYLGSSPLFYLGGILVAIVLPIPTFILGAFTGILSHLLFKGLSSKKSLFQIIFGSVLTIGLLGLIIFLANDFVTIITNLMQNMATIQWLQQLTMVMAPGLDHLNVRTLGSFLGVNILLFWAFIYWGSGNYFRLLALYKPKATAKKQQTIFTGSSPLMALFKRELSYYFSSSTYVMNTAIMQIMLIPLGILAMFNGELVMYYVEDFQSEVGLSGLGLGFLILLLVQLATMVQTTACAISLEGKGFPLLKQLPVAPTTIFWAKIGVNLVVCLGPLLIILSMFFWALPFTIAEMFLTIWISVGYSF
jgi:ABC-2 type transport system permease protein